MPPCAPSTGVHCANAQLVKQGDNRHCDADQLWAGFVGNNNPDACKAKCEEYADSCLFYSYWTTGWCSLTSTCSSYATDGSYNINVYTCACWWTEPEPPSSEPAASGIVGETC